MKKETGVPLIIQGVEMTAATVNNKISNTTGTFIKGRGKIVWIDFMLNEVIVTNGNTLGFSGGSVGVIVQEIAQLFRRSIASFLHNYLPTCIDAGQSYNAQIATTNNATTFNGNAIMHVYYDNPFDTPEFRAKLDSDLLVLQRQTFRIDLSSGIGNKRATASVTVPADHGNVCAVQFTYDGDPLDAMFANRFSISVDGVEFIINACAYLTLRDCTRKGLRWPIFIERESEITIAINDETTTGQTGIYGLTLFFDDDNERSR